MIQKNPPGPAGRDGAAAPEAASQQVRKRSLRIAGHRTSISLEDAFWHRLRIVARNRGCGVGELVAEIDRTRTGNLSSAIRVFVLTEFEAVIGPCGTRDKP